MRSATILEVYEKAYIGDEMLLRYHVYLDGMLIGTIRPEKKAGSKTYYSASTCDNYGYVGYATTLFGAKKLLVAHYRKHGVKNEPKQQKIKYLPSGDNADFYPTPSSLAGKMFAMLDLRRTSLYYRPLYVLEPSAGKGDLAESFRAFLKRQGRMFVEHDPLIDCIETDRNLQYLLRGKGEHLVHDDFLTFNSRKNYDVIIMNPPFSEGDKHLLKALELMKSGGQIVCLLNAETVMNPYTNRRHVLLQQLEKLKAKVQFVKGAFTAAERKTGVEVAIIHVDIPEPNAGESEIYERLRKARDKEFEADEVRAVASANPIENLIQTFNIEVDASLEFFKQYNALVPYIREEDDGKAGPLIGLSLRTASMDSSKSEYCGYVTGSAVNTFLRAVRAKYWRKLFDNHELMGKFTSNILEIYRKRVQSLSDYDFTEFNIRQVIEKMSGELNKGVEDSIMALFEKLSAEHSWYPECSQNIHYYNGWKTNKAHKVGMKAIIPSAGAYSTWSGDLDEYHCASLLDDLEKSLNYLNSDNEVDVMRLVLSSVIRTAKAQGKSKNIDCTYFTVTFYKKGTCHIKFHEAARPLIDRLNIFAAQRRGWLPPSYGKVAYDSMDSEAQAVVDSFQGKEAYDRVMAEPGRYLIDTSSMGLLHA